MFCYAKDYLTMIPPSCSKDISIQGRYCSKLVGNLYLWSLGFQAQSVVSFKFKEQGTIHYIAFTNSSLAFVLRPCDESTALVESWSKRLGETAHSGVWAEGVETKPGIFSCVRN